jgi:alginate O-acetyltransferase complex protein AlgI
MPILDPNWMALIAASILASWLSPVAYRPWAIASVTLLYLGLHEPPSVLFIAAMSTLTIVSGSRAGRKGLGTAATIVLLMGTLAAFKVSSGEPGGLVIPLGMSYYTFRCVHYLLERIKQKLPPHTTAEFLAYMFFLPTFIAGPIHRFPEFHRDFRRGKFSAELISAGFERILYGLAKILVLANFLLGQHLKPAIEQLAMDSPRTGAYFGMIVGGFTGYLLFAGYSDVAIGAARLMGFRVIENFNNPFISRNIIEFWQRWHISLTSWVRDYLYTTVFSLTRKPFAAAFAAMLVIGLWHEVSARYVLWGLVHGVAIALCQWYQRRRGTKSGEAPPRNGIVGRFVGWFVTFHFVMLSIVMVQYDTAEALRIYATLFGVSS